MSPHLGFSALLGALLATCVVGIAPAHHRNRGSDTGATRIIVLNDNGAWSWFEDERAVVDETTATLLVSSVANAHGTGGASRDGNVEVAAYQLTTNTVQRTVLHAHLQADDHDSAALYVRPDGRYVAMYSTHASDPFTRWRTTLHHRDSALWAPESRLDNGAPVTYSNMYPTSDGQAKQVLYSFVRSAGRDPHILVSGDDGATWTRGGRLLDGPGRPYLRYAADGSERIHVIATEQHPLDYPNRIYHGVIAHGRLLRSDGTVVDADVLDGVATTPQRLTQVFAGSAADHAWTIDAQIDRRGNPYVAFSVHTRPAPHATTPITGTQAHYYYARTDGTTWRVYPLAPAGTPLSEEEPFYTGLVALDPHDPNHLFISTDIDPRTGAPLVSARDHRRHHELFEGRSDDGGTTWSWIPLTADSTVDNIRPVVPIWHSDYVALTWLRGTYTTYRNYDLAVVAVVSKRERTTCDSHTSDEPADHDGPARLHSGGSDSLAAPERHRVARTGFSALTALSRKQPRGVRGRVIPEKGTQRRDGATKSCRTLTSGASGGGSCGEQRTERP